MDSIWVIGESGWDITKIAKPLEVGDSINTSNAVWDTTMLYLTDHSSHMGGTKNVNDWVGGDKYLGLKYQNGSTISYGWIRLQCNTEDSCYVKDYSYSPLTTEGIKKEVGKEVRLFPNPSGSVFYLSGINVKAFDSSRLKLTDIYGKEIKFSSEVKGNELKIDLDQDLPAGCYLLHYFSNDYMFSKKLLKFSK